LGSICQFFGIIYRFPLLNQFAIGQKSLITLLIIYFKEWNETIIKLKTQGVILISQLGGNSEIVFVLKPHRLEKLFSREGFFFNQKLEVLKFAGHRDFP
jgi:hypothetical protein